MDGNAFTGETKRQIPTLELAYSLLVLTVRNAGNSCPLLEKNWQWCIKLWWRGLSLSQLTVVKQASTLIIQSEATLGALPF